MITSITRDWAYSPAIVRIESTDNLATITAVGYLTSQLASIIAVNAGPFEWDASDYVLIYYAGTAWAFFTYDIATDTLTTATVAGSLSNALPSANIFVGSAANLATGVALTGAATISNTGVLTIANNAVDYAQLAADVAVLGTVTLTAAQILGMYAAPVVLVAAPGVGNLIQIDSILWDIAFVTTQYAAGGPIQAQYGATINGGGPAASASIAAATLNGVAASGFLTEGSTGINVTKAASLNTGVYLSNTTGAFTTGNSTVTLYVKYRVMTPV